MMPRTGGEYVFIREAYGSLWGFLHGWTRFFVANSGITAALASAFAIFVNVVSGGALAGGVKVIAISGIIVVTLINCASVTVGGRIASVLAGLKALLIVGIGLAGFLLARGDWMHFAQAGAGGSCEGVGAAARGGLTGFGAAMIGALWAYNGWNEVTYVAGEVKRPERNLPLAIIIGIIIVISLYVFVNGSYFYVLTPQEVASISTSSSAATEVVERFLGARASRLMAGVMAMSIFGALVINSMVHARIPFAMARDGLFFRYVAELSPHTRVPIHALLVQAVWASVLVLCASFDALTNYATFAVVIFTALATSSVFVFRRKMPDANRPYKTWGYPVVPLVFLIVAGWLIVNTVMTTPREALAGLGLMMLGLPFYWYWSSRKRVYFT
jgi:APA family basic amino acid/polyamine antiporter